MKREARRKDDDDGKMDFWTREQRSERRAEREGRTDGGRQGRRARLRATRQKISGPTHVPVLHFHVPAVPLQKSSILAMPGAVVRVGSRSIGEKDRPNGGHGDGELQSKSGARRNHFPNPDNSCLTACPPLPRAQFLPSHWTVAKCKGLSLPNHPDSTGLRFSDGNGLQRMKGSLGLIARIPCGGRETRLCPPPNRLAVVMYLAGFLADSRCAEDDSPIMLEACNRERESTSGSHC